MKQLIINADDFGLHPSINSGIMKGVQQGGITSTTIMPAAGYFEDAVSRALAVPGLGIGVHLTLVGEKPVCPSDKVSSLIDRQGNFAVKYPQFLLRFLSGRICLAQIETEFSAQIAKVMNTGIRITHLDSHQHLHIMPGIIDIVLALAARYKIKAVRIPDEAYFFQGGLPLKPGRMLARTGLTILARRARCKAGQKGVLTPDHFFGMLAGGHMSEQQLCNIVEHLPDGSSEIMIHPGSDDDMLKQQFDWNYHWEAELRAVTGKKIIQRLTENKVRLISFGELRNA